MTRYNMTLRAALDIQEKQVKHYGDLYPDGEDALRAKLRSMTDVEGQDLDVVRDMLEINERVPRGGVIERLFGVDFGGE